MTGLYLIIVIAAGIALWSLFESRSANGLHKRVNDLFRRVSETNVPTYAGAFTAIDDRLDKLERECFRGGVYPDLGLRAWCRNWREKLRVAVRVLQGRADAHDAALSMLTSRVMFLEDGDKRILKARAAAKRAEVKADKMAKAEAAKLARRLRSRRAR